MPPKPTMTDRLGTMVENELNKSTDRLAGALKGDFNSGDVQNVPTPVYHDMIRQNWGNPQWRASEAFRMGPIKFVQTAMDAFGLPREALKAHANNLAAGQTEQGSISSMAPDNADAQAEVDAGGTAGGTMETG